MKQPHEILEERIKEITNVIELCEQTKNKDDLYDLSRLRNRYILAAQVTERIPKMTGFKLTKGFNDKYSDYNLMKLDESEINKLEKSLKWDLYYIKLKRRFLSIQKNRIDSKLNRISKFKIKYGINRMESNKKRTL